MAPQRKLIVLDRDGVINYDSDDYIKSPAEWVPLPGSLEAIARLCGAGFEVYVVSNQSGIGRGLVAVEEVERIHAKMRAAVEAAGGCLHGIYYCPHQPADRCACRKPSTGLLLQLQAAAGLESFAGVPLIGDKPSDLELATRVGARGILVLSGKGRETGAQLAAGRATETFRNLEEAVAVLLGEARA
jgi:D-glycero-D-manno-heptose 1,7-bisphosphate phosphatase